MGGSTLSSAKLICDDTISEKYVEQLQGWYGKEATKSTRSVLVLSSVLSERNVVRV